jgi:hypothetical protein
MVTNDPKSQSLKTTVLSLALVICWSQAGGDSAPDTGHLYSMGLVHFRILTEGIINIGHAFPEEEGKEAELNHEWFIRLRNGTNTTVTEITHH